MTRPRGDLPQLPEAAIVIDVDMRWGDMDVQGHVNNATYVDYLEEARTRFLDSGPGYLLDEGIVVVAHQVEYVEPITFSMQPIRVWIGVTRVGAARIDLGYEVYHHGRLRARATTTLCPFDFEAATPRRMSDGEREWFRSRLGPDPALDPVSAPALNGRGVATRLQTRWTDCDQYGHVNNVRFYDFVQEARISLRLTSIPGDHPEGREALQLDSTGHLWLVARQDMDYVSQMTNRSQPYEVLTAPIRLGNTSMVLASEIVDPGAGGEIKARSRAVMVYADANGVPTPLPDDLRAALTPQLV